MRTELVGRGPELAVLETCLAAAVAGHPQMVLCQGEPGIGKTRLAVELTSSAAAQGVLSAVADNAFLPPEASATLRSVDVYPVARDDA